MTWSAHLPIYDLPELREGNDVFWQAVATVFRDAGISDVPDSLGGSAGRELFSQVCGFPLQTTQRGRYALIGTPIYAVAGCADATHCAFIIVRDPSSYKHPTDLLGARFAINEHSSNTGMNLPRRYFARLAGGAPFFARVTLSGSHAASVEQVVDGQVDAAAIDCVTYAFLAEYRPDLVRATRILAQTEPSPAIPFVTINDGDMGRIAALRRALARLSREARFAVALRALRITSIRCLDDAAYTVLRCYEREAVAAGYPVLC
jgi:ABC-type phosphate/phosphonate transport system substrate-binding protein